MENNNNNSRVPKLRFPGFEGEWEEKKVEDLFRVTRGVVLPMKEVSSVQTNDKPYAVYSSQTLNNGLAGYYKEYLFENAITWTTDGANAGEVRYRKGKFYCTNVCGVLLNTDGFANECIAAIINSVSKGYVSYVGNPKLMNNVMAQIPILIPPSLAEQQKIAECLTEMDETISVQAQKVESLKDHKKGLMQQLFPQPGENTPKLRFPGFEGDWVEKKLEEFGPIITGSTPSRQNTAFWNGDFCWVSAQDMKEKYIFETKEKITEEGKKQCRLLPKNSVLVTCIASIGLNSITKVECATNQQINAIVAKDEQEAEFIYQSIERYTPLLKALAGQTAVPIVNKQQFCNFKILVPPTPDEQQKIAQCLSELDKNIEAESAKLEALKIHKKGLMQQLFPEPIK